MEKEKEKRSKGNYVPVSLSLCVLFKDKKIPMISSESKSVTLSTTRQKRNKKVQTPNHVRKSKRTPAIKLTSDMYSRQRAKTPLALPRKRRRKDGCERKRIEKTMENLQGSNNLFSEMDAVVFLQREHEHIHELQFLFYCTNLRFVFFLHRIFPSPLSCRSFISLENNTINKRTWNDRDANVTFVCLACRCGQFLAPKDRQGLDRSEVNR